MPPVAHGKVPRTTRYDRGGPEAGDSRVTEIEPIVFAAAVIDHLETGRRDLRRSLR